MHSSFLWEKESITTNSKLHNTISMTVWFPKSLKWPNAIQMSRNVAKLVKEREIISFVHKQLHILISCANSN